MSAKLKTLIGISLVISIIIFTHYIGWLRPIENFFHRLINPGSEIMYKISLQFEKGQENFNSVEDLKLAYQDVKQEILKEKFDLAKLMSVEQENDELRQQLRFLQKKEYKTIGAEVIGKNIDPIENTLVVNRGINDGVQLGNPVMVGYGILIGKVAKISDSTSVIRLLNDNQSKVAVSVMNQNKSIGLLEGGYGISIRLNYIPQQEALVIGDTIMTSGLEAGMPDGLIIGQVEAVEKEAFQPFQSAVISPLADLDKISLVSIILSVN